MLRRIEVKNFKSLKHLDYKCAKLNLLTGLNGAGKSSFVQSLLLLRALEKHIEKEYYEMPLHEIAADDGATFDDLKYCYAKPEEKVEFGVDFDVNIGKGDRGQAIGHIARVIRPSVVHKGMIVAWNSECMEANDSLVESMFSLPPDSCDNSHVVSRPALPGSCELTIDDFEEQQEKEKLELQAKSQMQKAMMQERPFVQDYQSLWKRANMISAFRGRPQQIHHDNPKESWFMGARFNPEGSDVGGFLAAHGMECFLSQLPGEVNPLIFPGTDMHDVPVLWENRKRTFLLEQIQMWLNVISPGAKVAFEKVAIGSLELYVQTVSYGDKKFKPENVGFGVSDILPVLTSVLTSHPGDILIIENPEVHLHPKGQAKMGELLARAATYGVQLFVETHSDHVINGIRVAVADKLIQPGDVNIAFFERREHGVSHDDGSVETETYAEVCNIKMDKRGFLSEYPEGFMDEWNNQLLELS